MQPLTHHEIIGLVEPFTRRGRQVDLAASNRLERCLVFKPVEHAGDAACPGPLRETLKLENPYEGSFVLTRSLQLSSGLQARLQAEGADAGALLKHVEAVPPQRQFRVGAGSVTALSFRLEAWARKSEASAQKLILTDAVSRFSDGYTLSLRLPRVTGVSADLELAAPAGSAVTLPEDLLAVIGWDWASLLVRKGLWTSKLRLRGSEPKRSASAEDKLERTVQHLAHTLSQTPAAFHDQHVRARWGVVLRRGIPLLTVVGMFVGVALMPRLDLAELSPMRMMMFQLPTLLLAIAFSMQELPRFEIPPWPRRLKASAWPHDGATAPPDGRAEPPCTATR